MSETTIVHFDGPDADELRRTIRWLETVTRDQRVATLVALLCCAEEQEAKLNRSAAELVFNVTASFYRAHHTVYGTDLKALKDLLDAAFAVVHLEAMPTANTRPF